MKPQDMPPEDNQAPAELLAWDAFIAAKTADERCRAWLALVCSRIAGAQSAAVLVESLDAQTFVPMAVWPQASKEMGRLGGIVERALRERRGVVQSVPEKAGIRHFAYPLLLDQRVAGVVALETSGNEAINDVLREVHWGSAWLANLLGARELDEAIRARDRVGSVLEVTATALRHGKLQQALFDVANDLRHRFGCSRVAIGLVDETAVKMAALSEAATFEKRTPMVKAYVAAMEEAYDLGKAVVASVGPAGDKSAGEGAMQRYPAHGELLEASGAAHALSQPLLLDAQCVGVVTLERNGEAFSQANVEWLDAFAALAASIIEQRRAAERSSLRRMLGEAKRVLHKIFGPRHLLWKAATSLVVASVALMLFLHIDYRVTAKTVIEGEVQRVAAAPFEGFIGGGFVRAGDMVKQGQLLAQLDDRELKVEQAKWASERDQFDRRLLEAMANHDLTAVQVVGAQLRQAQAQLALITEKIERARIVAPYDGVVISGDLNQQIGSPVESGKKLFEIAPLQSYRVILQVDEREIRHVHIGQAGRLVITGIAAEPMPLTVAKVTPVATAQDGRNFFRVEATLPEAPARLRPGMEGVGKIEVGSRRLWWVVTHSFTEWLTLSLWTWLP
jgi:hypothetical protein